MQNWQGYITALNQQSHPTNSMPQVPRYETSSSKTGKTGFMDLIASKPEITAKYDAMSSTWVGAEATEQAVVKGLFKSEAMPVDLPKYESSK